MTFKTILFCLFLYICLVWIGAVYLYSGPNVERFGLLWTAAGLATVLAAVLFSRVWSWTRDLRSRAAQKPKRPVTTLSPVSESEAAIDALINEAAATLRQAAAYGERNGEIRLSSLPLYLLIGPEESGKTSTFINSGLEPQLLAGDAAGPQPFVSTRLCNFWLARGALFVEISGRAFSGDLGQWKQILRALNPRPSVPAWRRFPTGPQDRFSLRALVAFCDVKEFRSASTPQGGEQLDRQSRDWSDRLGAVAETFGAGFPVYFLLTKCDGLPYFADFFRRLPESEADQVLGCTLSTVSETGSSGKSVDAAARRVSKSFTALYHVLAERRVWHLSHEPETARRRAIYEFPRELKRLRPAITQFLSRSFRSHPLRPNPHLRGYYFSATGERQAPQNLLESGTHEGRAQVTPLPDPSVNLEATALFRADATRIIRPGEGSFGTKVAIPTAMRRWLFVFELFHELVLSDRVARVPSRFDARLERQRLTACAIFCGLCLLLCFAFANSWMRNRELLDTVSDSAELRRRDTTPTLAELQSLEKLRVTAGELLRYEHDGAPLGLRWGLYTGSRMVGTARDLYFRRFRDLLLNPLNAVITTRLTNLPASPAPEDPYTPAFRMLETHLTISSGACKANPALVSEVLKSALEEAMPPASSAAWQSLAARQIDFYADELRYGNPSRLIEDTAARDRARQYLAQLRGTERIYDGILAAGEKTFTKPQRLRDLSPDYTAVLSGPAEVGSIFTRDGWSYIEQASKKNAGGTPGDACVLGQSGALSMERAQNEDVGRDIRRLFVRDYIEHWRQFVTGFSVKSYGGPGDAARKLEMLSNHRSPLLALLAMTSNQTNFPQTAAEPQQLEKGKSVVKKFFPSLGNKVDSSTEAARGPTEPPSATAEITRSFQPLHWVVAPGSNTWVTDKNSAYIDTLAQLGRSMRDIERSWKTPDQAIFQAASQNYDKALDAARQIARGFEPASAGGLDTAVAHLLEAPIRQTQRFIITDINSVTAGRANGPLRTLCARLSSTIRKYPFSPSGQDAGLDEVASLFAPGNGAIWKFQAESLGDFATKDGSTWKSKDPAKKPQVTQEMLTFLNRAQAVTDTFYPGGVSQPRFTFTLRPKLDSSYKDAVVELEVDGQVQAWHSSLQKQFTWPSAGPGRTPGVIGRIKMGSLSFPFASRGGTWGIFRVMGDAEPRPLGSKLVEWKYVRGGDGRLEEIKPAPVRLEIVEFPGGVDLFNPQFFQGLQCPSKAVQ